MEDKRGQQPLSPQQYSPEVCSEDEIDLVELWCILVRQWKVICTITALTVLAAVAYVRLATPVYEVQAVVKPPASKYVEVLNIPATTIEISSTDIFAMYIENLKSGSLLQQFVDENRQFSRTNGLVITEGKKVGKKNEGDSATVSLQGHDSKLIADWVNGFILFADRRTIDDFCDSVEINIANRKKAIQDQLQKRLDSAGQRRLDKIALLDEQISIARAAKIIDRQLAGYSTVGGQSVEEAEDTLQRPMYMRGVKELTAEKEELEKRKNDEPFIDGFRNQQERLALLDTNLQQLQTARSIAHAVKVDRPATQAKTPVKPKPRLLLALSLVLGLIVGVFAAFLVNFVQQRRTSIKLSENNPLG